MTILYSFREIFPDGTKMLKTGSRDHSNVDDIYKEIARLNEIEEEKGSEIKFEFIRFLSENEYFEK
jgi:hypothetical protein